MAERLQARQPEITAAILDRLHSMEGDSPVRDAEYLKGLREAVSRGVEYGVDLVARGERSTHAPLPLVIQARLAARQGISLAVVLRRYCAGKTVLSQLLLEEAGRIELGDPNLIRDALAGFEAAFERILEVATEEYQRESEAMRKASDSHFVRRVRQLLDSEPVDSSILNYDLNRHHLGLVALGPGVRPLVREVAAQVGGHVLIAGASPTELWVWIGAPAPIDSDAVSTWADERWPDAISLGIGEPAMGQAGWRRSHAQASAAARLATRKESSVLRYRDVALAASASRDPLLLASLRQMYLVPLHADQRGQILRRTLFTYLSSNQNSSSAAAALGVSRQTVANRLQDIEDRLSQPIAECGSLLQAALQLDALGLFDDD